jgi:hypothetical protein
MTQDQGIRSSSKMITVCHWSLPYRRSASATQTWRAPATLVIVAMVLGIVVVVAKGLLYLLIIGIVVFLGAFSWVLCGCGGALGSPRFGNP